MDKRPLISPPFRWVAIFGGLICLFSYWLFKNYAFYPVERDLGPNATVRFTPYHTAGELLKLNKTEIEHYRDLKKLNLPIENVDTILLAAKPGHINQQKLDQLLKWVEAGGHLYYWVNRKTETDTDKLLNHLDAALIKDKSSEEDQEIESLLELGEEVLPMLGDLKIPEQEPVIVTIDKMDTKIKVGFNPTWHLLDYSGNAYYFTENDDDKDHILQYWIGEGSINLMSDMNIWHNSNIKNHDNGFFLNSMVTSGKNQTVWFIFGGEHESALNKLKKHAIPLFWIGLAFIIFWLWREIPRLGPKLKLNLYQRRNIGEHIKASSQLRWQQRQSPQWLQSHAKKIFKKAALRNPAFSNMTKLQQIDWLSNVAAVDKSKLEFLYDQTMLDQFKEVQFLELMHELQQLKNRL